MTDTSKEAVERSCRIIHDAICNGTCEASEAVPLQDALRALSAERDAQADRIDALIHEKQGLALDAMADLWQAEEAYAAQVALQAKLDEAVGALEWLESRRQEAEMRVDWEAPEDAAVKQLCEKHGYGAVMDSAARQWARICKTGAFYVGGCLGDTSARAALAKIKAEKE